MDKWQKSLHEKLLEFIGDGPEDHNCKGVRLGLLKEEVYMCIKALESQSNNEQATGGYFCHGGDFVADFRKAVEKQQ